MMPPRIERRRISPFLLGLSLLLVAVGGFAPAYAEARQAAGSPAAGDAAGDVVARGFVNPRGFAFRADGGLVVASGGGAEQSAGIDDLVADCARRIVDGWPTAGVAFGARAGIADVAVSESELYALVAGGDTDRGDVANGVYRVDTEGEMRLVANISAFIRANPVAEKPGDFDSDGQPYAMLATPEGDAFFVSEGNSNQILRAGLDGTVERVVDLSAGHPIPTGIALTPDGGLYVGFLTAAPYREGTARVVEVDPAGDVTEVWSGLSLITALAVDDAGELYALEMASGYGDDPGGIAPGSGRVVRQTGQGSAETVVEGLALPVAMEFGPDGGLYVAGPAFGADGGEGWIVRVDVRGATPVTLDAESDEAGPCREMG